VKPSAVKDVRHRELFTARGLPVLQNKTFATKAEAIASDVGDIRLVEDGRTGLIHNSDFEAAKLRYDIHYQNEQSNSSAFQRHLAEVKTIIARTCQGRRIIEIGCGKGAFLEDLRSLGYDVTGIDPAYEGESPHILKTSFVPGFPLNGDAIMMRHVLEHIVNPIAFLADILEANKNRGLIYIEVPCFDWICQHRTWFDIFYEHVNYFRLSDFDRMFGRVIEMGRLFGDQYLYVVADLSTLRKPLLDEGDRLAFPADFTKSRDRFSNLPKQPRAIWGGASKGVIFSMHLAAMGTDIDFVIDINPLKQGRYLPCSGLRVVSPEEAMRLLPAGSEVFVMNPNYRDEIIAASRNQYKYTIVDNA
jgi:SAM-dependent methyltransferase